MVECTEVVRNEEKLFAWPGSGHVGQSQGQLSGWDEASVLKAELQLARLKEGRNY